MGASTKFSASEAGSAFEYMAMAGWKTSDMMEGIEGIMNLAAASGEELGTTSDIVTDALTAFGLSAGDKMQSCVSSVQNAVQAMRDTMNFEWSLPYLRLPHVNVQGSFNLEAGTAPTFTVEWYKKSHAGWNDP